MEDHGFLTTSPVKRKPLPQDSRHSRTISNSSFQADAFPLVPVGNNPSWSPPHELDDVDTSYEVGRRPKSPDTARIADDSGPQIFWRNNPYLKLSSKAYQKEEPNPPQKDTFVFENAIPDGTEQRRYQPYWNPVWLRPLVLSAFVILFLALLVGLVILWHFADVENGISTSITENHYAWTYGPTALLVLVGVAWRQVDFHCRTLAPWSHLRHGPVSAQRGLLLDYVSPMLPKTLAMAAANHDWPVVASGLGLLLLRIVIVFSTGLLVLTPTPVSRIVDSAIVTSKFAGTDYTLESETGGATNERQYYGIQEQGLDYQYGTTGDVAYETIDLSSVRPSSIVTTTVNGFFPAISCEIVEPKIVGNNFTWGFEEEGELSLTLTLSPANCPPLRAYFTFCNSYTCPVGTYISSSESWQWPDSYDPFKPPLHDLDPCANLYLITMTELQFERVKEQPTNSSAAWNISMTTAVGLVCSLGYTIEIVNVTIDTANYDAVGGVNTTGPLKRVSDVMPGFSYYNLTMDLESIANYQNSLPTPPGAESMFGFVRLTAILNNGPVEALLNASNLSQLTEKGLTGVAVQVAHKSLRKSDNRTASAQESYQEQRLQIRMVSLWAMGTGFVLLAVSGMIVLIWRPRDAVFRNPNSVAAHAALLAASPDLQKLLEGIGSDKDSQLQRHLERTTAAMRLNSNNQCQKLTIETTQHKESMAGTADPSERRIIWWRPMSSSIWFMCLAFGLLLGVIVSLEVLQRESDAHDGLINISASSLVAHSLPSILASLILMSIAMMYDAINFAAATLAPYQALARGSATAHRTLLKASLGDLPIWSTLQAIRSHYGSAAMSSGAAVIGGLLTIIASGLYTIETVQNTSNLQVSTADSIVPSFSTLTDGGAGVVFSLIEHNNASYPALTYDELVFPQINRSSLGEAATKQLAGSELVTLQARVPAVRASLNCTLIPRENMVITNQLPPVARPDTSCPDTIISFNASLPDTCPHFLDGSNKTASQIQFSYTVQHICDGPSPNVFLQICLNNEGAVVNSAIDDTFLGPQGSTLGSSLNPPGCPSLAFLSGYYVVNSTSTENMTAMTCIQGIEQVQADTTFTISRDSIQVRSKPSIDENSTRWLEAFNSTFWFTSTKSFDLFDRAVGQTTLPDNFYEQVNYGPDGILPEELTGPANVDRFINATQHTYRQYMAQLINSNMRVPFNSTASAAAPRYPAKISDINVLRLKQKATSKLILQIFLGVMLACGVFVYSWRNMRHVLPHCPWSIAGTMSLLAGAEMVETKVIPAGAEFMSDRELEKVFEGYLFSLGWWRTGRGEGRRFGIDIGKADGRAGEGEGLGFVR